MVTTTKLFDASPINCLTDAPYECSGYPSGLPAPPIPHAPVQYATTTISLDLSGSDAGYKLFLSRTDANTTAPRAALFTGLKINGFFIGGARVDVATDDNTTLHCGTLVNSGPCLSGGYLGTPNSCGKNIEDVCRSNLLGSGGCLDLTPYLKNGLNTFSLWTTGLGNFESCDEGIFGCTECYDCRQIEMSANTGIYLWKVLANGINLSNLCCCVSCCNQDGTCTVLDGKKCAEISGTSDGTDSCGEGCGHPCCIDSGGSFPKTCLMLNQRQCCENGGGSWDPDTNTCTGGNSTWHADKDKCCSSVEPAESYATPCNDCNCPGGLLTAYAVSGSGPTVMQICCPGCAPYSFNDDNGVKVGAPSVAQAGTFQVAPQTTPGACTYGPAPLLAYSYTIYEDPTCNDGDEAPDGGPFDVYFWADLTITLKGYEWQISSGSEPDGSDRGGIIIASGSCDEKTNCQHCRCGCIGSLTAVSGPDLEACGGCAPAPGQPYGFSDMFRVNDSATYGGCLDG